MRYRVNLMIPGKFADPAVSTRLAGTVEGAGWDGMFVWDHRGYIWGAPFADGWVTQAAAAARRRN